MTFIIRFAKLKKQINSHNLHENLPKIDIFDIARQNPTNLDFPRQIKLFTT